MPIAIIVLTSPAPRNVITASARSNPGKVRSMSISRIKTASIVEP